MSGNNIHSTRDKGKGQATMLGGEESWPLAFSVVCQICRAGEKALRWDPKNIKKKKILKKKFKKKIFFSKKIENHSEAKLGGKGDFYLFWFFVHFKTSEGEPKPILSTLTAVA